ncbi:CARDB domain-containing protein [Halorussus lipolyticus]|uniref:CARDB domain-containing protein n=1 Tax=Halorussus lipolyticus TaxID=3034024 RepID=UPI0023E85CE8|nr:CARDB domain-containing protein [Halorussus sp. DT80]
MTQRETDTIDRRTLLQGVTAVSLLGGLPARATATGRTGLPNFDWESVDVGEATDADRQEDRPRFQYAVKFVCGEAEGERFARGRYRTGVNVHNPADDEVEFRWKVAPAFPAERAEPSDFEEFGLGPDGALEIDCRQIFEVVGGGGLLTGFVVIEADTELDVVAVYSAEADGVRTMDVERVSPRQLGDGRGNAPDLVPAEIDCDGRELFVRVQNRGSAPAGPSKTEVDFDTYGTQTRETPILAPGQSATLRFQIPLRPRNCYDPDCEFAVTVDATDAINESNETNNSLRERCLG